MTDSNLQLNLEEIQRTINFYALPGPVQEITCIGTRDNPKAIISGFFDRPDAAAKAALAYAQGYRGTYITVNPVNRALLSRAPNRFCTGISRTADRDVTLLRHLLIDLDPIRASGISSTDAEHQAALELGQRIRADLAAEGWPEPLLGDSGNGAHLVYRLPNLHNTQENVQLLKDCLKALAGKYDSDRVHVDTAVFNPSRIFKLYGTPVRKGDHSEERPWRLARIISVPEDPQAVRMDQVKTRAASGAGDRKTTRPAPAKTNGPRLDVAAYLDNYSCTVVKVKEGPGGSTLYCLDYCVFDPEHSPNEAAIGQTAEGKLFYLCFHNSCKGRTWEEARKEISGDDLLTEFMVGAADAPAGRKGKVTQAQLLMRFAANIELFHDPDGTVYSTIPVNNHWETWPVRSKVFRRWLAQQYFATYGKPPGSQGVADALQVMEAEGQFNGPEYEVFTRVAGMGGKIYVDLGNPAWEAIEIRPDGWGVVTDPPVKFRRSKGILALPHPVPGGSLNELRQFLNCPDDNAWRLIVAWLVQGLNPRGPYPVLIVEGEQGSAKSTTTRTLKSLVDPSTSPIRTAPRNEQEFLIAATNSRILAFDNLSGVQPWLSDAFCRLSTGGGFACRELYSDTEETIFDCQRPLILNGIDQIAYRQDLADRAIILNLPAIPDDQRVSETDFRARFEAARPRILGALLDAMKSAMTNIDQVKLSRLPRMADFALWVVAAESALPWKVGGFLEAYDQNRGEGIETALAADPVSVALQGFLHDKPGWRGTASDLLENLRLIVPEDVRRLKSWPKAPHILSGRLKRSATFLRATGIEVVSGCRGRGGARMLDIKNTPAPGGTSVDLDEDEF